VDPDGRRNIVVDDEHGNPIADLPNNDIQNRVSIEVRRGTDTTPNEEYNDSVKILIDGRVITEYAGVQSEKNYKSGEQSRAERFENDLSDPNFPNATLPTGDNYSATLEPGNTYDRSLRITNPDAQIPGVSQGGILASWGFLFHSMSDRVTERSAAFSWGCQIMPDESFARFRAQLEGFNLRNGNSVPLRIR
jgi:hypothetical protein